MDKSSKKVLETYEKRIIDLSRRNRLLKYPKSARSIDFSMTLEEFQEHFGIVQELEIPFIHKDILFKEQEELEDALIGVKQAKLLEIEGDGNDEVMEAVWIPPTKPEGKKLITTLTALRLDSKRKFEEHGLHTLFISVGKVQWKEAQAGRGSSGAKKENEYDYNAPLLLIPVLIEEKRIPKKTVISTYDQVSDVTVNKVLSLLLEKEYGTRKLVLNEALLADLPELIKDLSKQITNLFAEIHIPVTISNEIQIGQYSFYGQQIYEDIKNNEDVMLENEFLNALCTHTPISQENLSIAIETSDNFLTAKDDFTVMDADTSQLEVIERVVQGNSLNVQGPPGTGKSQTIVNIIANLIERDKTVLLVCEKQVALEVVLNRLKEVGLDKLCLPLFKYNTDKKTFAKSIIDDRNALSKIDQHTHLEEDLRYREKIIKDLRSYATALGEAVEPLEKSVFWVHGELAKHKEEVSRPIPWKGEDPLSVTYENYRSASNILKTLDPLLPSVRDEKHSHWRIVNKEQFSSDYFSRTKSTLKSIDSNINLLVGKNSPTVSWSNRDELQTYLNAISGISGIPQIPSFIKSSSTINTLNSILQEMVTILEKFTKKEKSFTNRYLLPDSWETFIKNDYDEFSEDLSLDQINSIALSFSRSSNFIRNANELLEKLKFKKPILDKLFVNLLVDKDVLSINSNISIIKNWQLNSVLEDLAPTLQNLTLLNSKLLDIKVIVDKWGVIEETLDLEEVEEICKRFNEKYNIINRFFYGQYRSDASKIKRWCNAKSPSSFNDFKEISSTIYDQFQQRKKLNALLKSFTEKYTKAGTVLVSDEIPELNDNVKKIIAFLSKSGKEKMPTEYFLFIVNNSNQDTKKALGEALSQFENEYFKILKILPSFNISENMTFVEFVKYVSDISTKSTFLENLSNSVRNIIFDKKDYPATLGFLLKFAKEINELITIRDMFEKLSIDNIFDSSSSFQEHLDNKESLNDLSKNIISILNFIKDVKFRNETATVESIRVLLGEKKSIAESLGKILAKLDSDLTSLDSLFLTGLDLITEWGSISFMELNRRIKEMSSDEEGLASWMQFLKYKRQMGELGFEWFVEEILLDSNQNNSRSLFSVTLWQAWLDLYYEKSPALRNFTLQDHQRLIKEFKDLDNKSRKVNSLRVLQKMAKVIQEAKWKYSVLERELIHQSQLKMRHKPVRKLVSEIGNQIVQYKRCWMMSPLTLSSYIPFGTLEFDTVIFDEASQMRVEHALGSIARAKQVIIFGDENQLPPTSFFDVTDQGNEDEDEEDYESVLQATKEILPGADRLLAYHYRSKYEDLIAFSNHYIYKDELITFPGPISFNPIEFVYLENGVFDGGSDGTRKNFEEADKVAQLCIDQVKEHPKKSLGVIAFSKSQEAAIRDSLTKLLDKYPECLELLNEDGENLEKFFIKNLESVQGDERDVIILTVGYGKDKKGNMYQRFGPINSSHGYRRLNVAISRAKEKIICVASIKATDIKSENASRGAQLLQKYLEYAEYGNQTLQASKLVQLQNDIDFDSPFEEEVEKALQSAGFIVHRQIGASGYKIDLAIVNPRNEKEYLLGIECDGATYHSSYSARMNDRIRQENLERLGWKLYRIWSQHWTTHAGAIIDDIINVVSDH